MAKGTFTLDQRQVRALADGLKAANEKAVPYAVRDALNTTAFEARKEWQSQLRAKMILRNKWTVGSLRVVKATGTALRTMQSQVGSLVPYMAVQEDGGSERAKGKHGVPIPTTTAAGQSLKAAKRTRQVTKRNWQSAIHLSGKVTGTRPRRNAVALRVALKSGGVAFLDLGRRKGLFRVTGSKNGKSMRIRMIWDMSRKSVLTKPHPTLGPTVKVIEGKAPAIQTAALQRQFDRLVLSKAKRKGMAGFF